MNNINLITCSTLKTVVKHEDLSSMVFDEIVKCHCSLLIIMFWLSSVNLVYSGESQQRVGGL